MTIDRAIEILDPNHRECYGNIEVVNEACRMGMEALKRQRWIPCSEKMPEIGVDVLVYSKYDGVAVDYFGGEAFGYSDVTHWMPLPEPPKEGGNGND